MRRADAIVNPKFLRAGDPLRTLPGVGVAFKLVQQLYELAGDADGAAQFLDLVALGIVADVAEQMHDTRYLLQVGLDRLRRTERIGLKALMESARLSPESVDAQSIGFQIGPRMNALGRLDDATVAVELLTTSDAIRAGQLAARMERLNNERRLLTSQIAQTAFDMLERTPFCWTSNAIVLAIQTGMQESSVSVAARLLRSITSRRCCCAATGGAGAGQRAQARLAWILARRSRRARICCSFRPGTRARRAVDVGAANIDRFRRELRPSDRPAPY